jgi:hypothetical protein
VKLGRQEGKYHPQNSRGDSIFRSHARGGFIEENGDSHVQLPSSAGVSTHCCSASAREGTSQPASSAETSVSAFSQLCRPSCSKKRGHNITEPNLPAAALLKDPPPGGASVVRSLARHARKAAPAVHARRSLSQRAGITSEAQDTPQQRKLCTHELQCCFHQVCTTQKKVPSLSVFFLKIRSTNLRKNEPIGPVSLGHFCVSYCALVAHVPHHTNTAVACEFAADVHITRRRNAAHL